MYRVYDEMKLVGKYERAGGLMSQSNTLQSGFFRFLNSDSVYWYEVILIVMAVAISYVADSLPCN